MSRLKPKSCARTPFTIEDDASAAGRTEQPLPAPGIPEPERTPADVTDGQQRPVPRTGRTLSRGESLANGALLLGLIRRVLDHCYPIAMTTFPNCSPEARRSNAARP